MTAPFTPTHIYIDQAVVNLPLTNKILGYFPNIVPQIVDDPKKFKEPAEMTWAKKGLMLARHKADTVLKSFDAVGESCGRPVYSLDIISNCHLECTYCILQSYLANNPMITIFTNIEEILEKLDHQIKDIPDNAIIGTGRIADSLALDPITNLSSHLVPFFAGLQKNVLLEFKTKSDSVENLLTLEHNQKTIVSFSLNPEEIQEREEFKTATIEERLKAAGRCAKAGYKIGFHLDPMIFHENWNKNYRRLVENIFETVSPEQIAWMSLGLLRFPARQQTIMKKRFPKNAAIHEGLEHTHLPYRTYSKNLREEMLTTVASFIKSRAPKVELYFCMESEMNLRSTTANPLSVAINQ
ncbi:MAG: radical SAM protein [Deltaproteobacteria bacterium]|nr:radical SAM protein [Deltaproteobacteria bacterium]